jgi:hypothetical protein
LVSCEEIDFWCQFTGLFSDELHRVFFV